MKYVEEIFKAKKTHRKNSLRKAICARYRAYDRK